MESPGWRRQKCSRASVANHRPTDWQLLVSNRPKSEGSCDFASCNQIFNGWVGVMESYLDGRQGLPKADNRAQSRVDWNGKSVMSHEVMLQGMRAPTR